MSTTKRATFSFRVTATQGHARTGVLTTTHGQAATPLFMPVATQASVKALTPEEVSWLGASMVLANAYHLYLRPGTEVVSRLGGLHRFMAWNGPILTDSGGFQVFSMGAATRVQEEGVLFRSHIDGSSHRMTPEDSTAIQQSLGADIAMCFDQCISYGQPEAKVVEAMERTHRWASRCKMAHDSEVGQALFGIVQGGVFHKLRCRSSQYITSLDFDGYAIGGLAVGESKAQMYQVVEQVTSLLPEGRPRYLMGVGSPEDLLEGVARGVDMFDCVLPTRVARNGGLFTSTGRVDTTHSRFQYQEGPVEEGCDCYACTRFSAAYLRHLFKAGELLGLRLASMHNLRFILRLMEQTREAIAEGSFDAFKANFLSRYRPTDEATRLDQFGKRLAKKARGQPG